MTLKCIWLAIAALVFAVQASVAAYAAEKAEAGPYRYQIIRTITDVELWRSSAEVISGQGNSAIKYVEFDSESGRERDGEWTALGILQGGSSDLGSEPVSIKVWTKEPARFAQDWSKDLSGNSDSAIAILVLNGAVCAKPDACKAQQLRFAVTNDGEVSVNGKKIGIVKN